MTYDPTQRDQYVPAPYAPGPDGVSYGPPVQPTAPKKKRPWLWALLIVVPLLALLACFGLVGGLFSAADNATGEGVRTVEPGVPDPGEAPVVDEPTFQTVKFGSTVTFDDKSTLVISKPETFKPGPYDGAPKAKAYVKVKATFTNRTNEIFDPVLTTASVSSDGVEAVGVYGEGMDMPSNKILPNKSVTWSMGYGVKNAKDLQLQINLGFLDYQTVIFTS